MVHLSFKLLRDLPRTLRWVKSSTSLLFNVESDPTKSRSLVNSQITGWSDSPSIFAHTVCWSQRWVLLVRRSIRDCSNNFPRDTETGLTVEGNINWQHQNDQTDLSSCDTELTVWSYIPFAISVVILALEFIFQLIQSHAFGEEFLVHLRLNYGFEMIWFKGNSRNAVWICSEMIELGRRTWTQIIYHD